MAYTLSPWFSGETPPVRPGVYEREVFTLGEARYAYFNGRNWSLWDTTPDNAYKISLRLSSQLDSKSRQWRGIIPPNSLT